MDLLNNLKSIYNNASRDQYGQVQAFELRLSVLKANLTDDQMKELESKTCIYGQIITYGGSLGTFKALRLSSQFYNEL